MTKLKLIIACSMIYSAIWGQDSLNALSYKNRFTIHYYPSALIAGDISCGIEHRYKRRIAQEISFNVKTFQPKIYYFDKGFRADYLVKYYLYNGNIFRFSTNLSFEYKDIYFVNKQIVYYHQDDLPKKPLEVYQILLEDRRHWAYGMGIGFSLNFKLFKRFSVGSDLGINFVNYKKTYSYKEVLYRDPYSLNYYQITIPSTYTIQNSRPTYSLLLRLKISYSLR